MKEKVDSVTLTEVIDRCLDYSMDGRFTQTQRTKFLALAKRLRGSLLNLLSARFDEGTEGLAEANASRAGAPGRGGWRRHLDAAAIEPAELVGGHEHPPD